MLHRSLRSIVFVAIASLFMLVSAVLPPMPAAAAVEHLVPYGTPVDVALEQPLSSHGIATGQQVFVRVLNDVVVDGCIVIARGARGVAEVRMGVPARVGAQLGSVYLRTLWVRAVDHSRIGIEGSVYENGEPRDILFVSYALANVNYATRGLGLGSSYSRHNVVGQASVVTGAIGAIQKGGEAVLQAERPIRAQIANFYGVRIASNISAGYEDDTPIK